MKNHFARNAASLLILLGCSGCGQDLFATHNTPQDLQQMQQGAASTKTQTASKHVPQQNAAAPEKAVQTNYASDGQDCNARAQSRMSMYDRPSTYPISDQERHDAFLALYSSCMHEHSWQVAGPVHAPATDASQFAALAPAAGGNRPPVSTVNAGNMLVSTSSVPGATVVVIGGNRDSISQLSSLSPSSGGSPNNATVVMVGQPQASYAAPTYAYAPAAPLPVAVPIAPPPVATAYAPAPQASPPPAPVHHARIAPPQPSLSGADAAVAGTSPPSQAVVSSEADNKQLENVLER